MNSYVYQESLSGIHVEQSFSAFVILEIMSGTVSKTYRMFQIESYMNVEDSSGQHVF